MKLCLDSRLKAVIGEIESCDKVADIGCDHGKIANLAVEITDNTVYATDISAPSLKKAQALSEELGYEDNLVCLAGDGLEPLKDKDIDTVIIAGIGGMEIIKILSGAVKRYKKYILVPHTHAERVRKYLVDNGYNIQKDYLVSCEKKFYPIIVVKGTATDNYDDFEMLFGKNDDCVRRECAINRLNELKSYVGKTTGEKREETLAEIKLIEDKYEDMRDN